MSEDCTLRFLQGSTWDKLHAAMSEAFSDYLLDMSYMTPEVFRNRARKNGVDLSCSPGAYHGGRLVGFTLAGLGTWEGEPAAFDACTGIVKAHRGKGLAGHLFDAALPALRQRGVRRFVLEVLQENAPAVKAYEKTGFRIARSFVCYSRDPEEAGAVAPVEIRPVGPDVLDAFAGELEWQPSWENSFAALRAIPDEARLMGAFEGERCLGIVACLPFLRWIAMLVVRRSERGRGIGTALLRHGLAMPGDRPVRITNVDASDPVMNAFLVRNGFREFTSQYEMVYELP